jgi:phospholipid/cholesterol/gamma-HCH transport system substrate-binding protein
MPRTRSLAWAELKFGLIAVFALVMAGLLIFAVGGSGGFFWQNYPLKVQFPNVAGLMSGSPVRVSGVEVGAVTGVKLVPNGAEVAFNIVDDMRPIVTNLSTAKIGSISLLGEGAVDIEAAWAARRFPMGLRADRQGRADHRRADRAGGPASTTSRRFADLRAGKGTVGKFHRRGRLTDFNSLLGAAADRVAHVANGNGTMGKLANDPKCMTSFMPRSPT